MFFISTCVKGLEFSPIPFYPKFARILFLSRVIKLDLMLILDSNSKFRNYLLNLDIHNLTLVPHKLSPHKLGYPWVMTPVGDALGSTSVCMPSLE